MIGQQRLATLTRRLCDMVEGGEAEVLKLIRVGRSNLMKARTPQQPYSLSLADVHALEMHVGQPVISRELADAVERGEGGNLLLAAVGMCREASDVPQAIAEALADGELSPNELERIEREVDEAQANLDAVKAACAGARAELLARLKQREGRDAR